MLKGWNEDEGLTWVEECPDFQRGHVWTAEKQIAYVEYQLRGGRSAKELQWNCSEWGSYKKRSAIQLVDGLQRLTAVKKFLNNELKAFGHLRKDYSDKVNCDFIFFVNRLQTQEEVLEWYLQLNDGGVVHTQEELDRVRDLLKAEKKAGKQ